ncbi:hypothetical protein ACPPVO_22500 [Dactylosporangium sp. McL0621]|uniref:hypothetical protein n=1 Tax=Dactylosporangium sp. McL0621 TaxID=3415678 RepID=UPI003CF2C50F
MTAIAKYCLCGGSMRGRVSPGESGTTLVAMFAEIHSGPGCGEATAAQAGRARRRQEARVLAGEAGVMTGLSTGPIVRSGGINSGRMTDLVPGTLYHTI